MIGRHFYELYVKKRLTLKAPTHINRFIESGRAAGDGALRPKPTGEKLLRRLEAKLNCFPLR